MSKWHVWGDFLYTRSEQIGSAQLVDADDPAARKTAESQGFNFDRRLRNGFEPWTATFEGDVDEGQDFAFASDPVVRGWRKI